jgi:3-oxoacid CoA-transferase subunit A
LEKNVESERQMLSGELDVELTPQGTQLRSAAQWWQAGIPSFTPAAMETEVAEGKWNTTNGKMYIMELAYKAGISIVKAWKETKWVTNILKEQLQL